MGHMIFNPFLMLAAVLAINGVFLFLMWKRMRRYYNDNLESEVQSRLKAVTALSEEDRVLLGILFHDLATPISVIEFVATRYKPGVIERVDVQTLDKSYGKLQRALTSIREIVTKVKVLQELRSGKRSLVLEPVDPVEVTHEVVELYEDQLNEKNLQINIESYLNDKKWIQADRALLKNEILANIISNAIKFSPGNRLIDICFVHDDDKHVMIQIRDYGIGIPKEMMGNIFEFSKRTTRKGTKNEPGSGLGLPLAKTCVQMMAGSIDVESYAYEKGVSGPGTSFTLRFQTAS